MQLRSLYRAFASLSLLCGYRFAHIPNSRGSFTLGAILATSAGLFLTLLTVQLSRFALAHNAVEQAALAAARCVTPTDAECLSEGATLAPTQNEWIGVTAGHADQTTVRRWNYSAAVYEDTYQADYPAALVHYVQPTFSVSGVNIPVQQFAPVTNGFELRFAHVQERGVRSVVTPYYRPAQSAFPVFDLSTERAYDDEITSTDYLRAINSDGSTYSGNTSVLFQYQDFQTIIPNASSEEFTTAIINVPAIDPTIACSPGYSCDFSVLAGGTDSWQSSAYVSIKAQANVRRAPGETKNPRVKWGELGSGPGLYLDVWAPGQSAPTTICLGGRVYSDSLGDDWKGYNLWVRGPSGSNGGPNAVCPGGDIDHSNLTVPRGGKFRVRGILKTWDGLGAAEVQVRLSYLFTDLERDDQTSTETKTLACAPEVSLVPAASGKEKPLCPSAVACGFSKDFAVASNSCAIIAGSKRTQPSCTAVSGRTFPVTKVTGTTMTIALCNGGIESVALPPAPKGTLHCEWKTIGPKNVVFSTAKISSCPTATNHTEVQTCSALPTAAVPEMQDGKYGPLSDCASANDFVAKANSVSEELDFSAAILGGTRLPALQLSSLSWGPPQLLKPDRWSFQWGSADPHTTSQPQVVSTTSTELRHQSGSTSIRFHALGPDGSSPPQTIVPAISLLSTKTVPIDEGYPFAQKPEYELSKYQLTHSEFNCAVTSDDDLHHTLRDYAQMLRPELNKSDVVVDTHAEFVDEKVLRSSSSCEGAPPPSLPLPPCTPTKEVSRTVACYPGIQLGVFSSATDPNGPPACHNGTFASCYSYPVQDAQPLTFNVPVVHTDIAAAKGMSEVFRVFPSAKVNCQNAGCAELSVDLSDNPIATVTARYWLPLQFPLNVLLGREELPVEFTKRDSVELLSLQRQSENLARADE